jgi:salicylate hydroxylase
LLAWGFDPIRAKLVTMKCKIHAKADTLEPLHVVKYESSSLEKYGAPWFL